VRGNDLEGWNGKVKDFRKSGTMKTSVLRIIELACTVDKRFVFDTTEVCSSKQGTRPALGEGLHSRTSKS